MEPICALCGKPRKAEDLVCPRCYILYQKEAPERYRQKREVIELVDWVAEKVQEKLAEFQPLKERLLKKEEEYQHLQKEAPKEERRVLGERMAGKRLPREVLQSIKEEIRKEAWQKIGGNRLFAELQTLREEVEEKTSALEETLQRIEEIKKGRALRVSVDRLLESVNLPTSPKKPVRKAPKPTKTSKPGNKD